MRRRRATSCPAARPDSEDLVRGPCAWRRRRPETDFAQMSIGPPKGDSRPASAQRLQRDAADGANGSISLGSSPRAARQRPIWSHGTAPLTPRLGAPRPPTREHAPAHRLGEAAATAQGRPARVGPLIDLLLGPSKCWAGFQPPQPRPRGGAAACSHTVPAALLSVASLRRRLE